jgi:hypothetical protein
MNVMKREIGWENSTILRACVRLRPGDPVGVSSTPTLCFVLMLLLHSLWK